MSRLSKTTAEICNVDQCDIPDSDVPFFRSVAQILLCTLVWRTILVATSVQYFISGSLLLSLSLGLLIAVIMLLVDRSLNCDWYAIGKEGLAKLNSTLGRPQKKSFLRKLNSRAVFRVLISIILGIILAIPIELAIFKASIKAEIASQELTKNAYKYDEISNLKRDFNTQKKMLIEAIEINGKSISDALKQRADIVKSVSKTREEIQIQTKLIICEETGESTYDIPCSKIPKKGRRYKTAVKEALRLNSHLEDLVKDKDYLQAELRRLYDVKSALIEKLNQANVLYLKQRKDLTVSLEEDKRNINGYDLLVAYRALISIAQKEPLAFYFIMLVIAFFFMFDLAPFLFIQRYAPDYALHLVNEQHERASDHLNKFRIRQNKNKETARRVINEVQ